MKKGILINVKDETITEVEVRDGIDGIYEQVGCQIFEVVGLNETNDIYVDEEGLLGLTPDTKFFSVEGYPQPLAGNGLVLGFNHETGDSVDTDFDIEKLKGMVKFHTLMEIQMMV